MDLEKTLKGTKTMYKNSHRESNVTVMRQPTHCTTIPPLRYVMIFMNMWILMAFPIFLYMMNPGMGKMWKGGWICILMDMSHRPCTTKEEEWDPC